MYYPDNEIDNAVKTLDEHQGEQISDEHEDSNVYNADDSDLSSEERSTYKKESALAKKEYQDTLKAINEQKNLEISNFQKEHDSEIQAHKQSIQDLIPQKKQEIEEKFAPKIEEAHKRYEARCADLDDDPRLAKKELKETLKEIEAQKSLEFELFTDHPSIKAIKEKYLPQEIEAKQKYVNTIAELKI